MSQISLLNWQNNMVKPTKEYSKIDDNLLDKFAIYHRNGYTVSQMCKILNISRYTYFKIADVLNLRRYKKVTQENADKVMELSLKGMSAEKIARILKCPRYHVEHIKREYSINRETIALLLK